MASALTRLNPPTLPDASAAGYSQIIVAEPGRLAFVSGQVALPPDGGPIPDGLGAQAEVVSGNLGAALDALGAAPTDIVQMRIYVVDLTPARLAEGMPRLMALLDGARPTLTGIGVVALAAPEMQLEVEMVVRLPA